MPAPKMWTDEKIEETILKIVKEEELKHFPTQPMLKEKYGYGLIRAITNSIGAEGFARKLGLIMARERYRHLRKNNELPAYQIHPDIIENLDEYEKKRLVQPPTSSWLKPEEIEKKFKNIKPEPRIQTYYVGV